MSSPFVPLDIYDHRRRFLYSCPSIKDAAERTGLKYVTIQKASISKSHRCKNYFIVRQEKEDAC